MKDILKRFFQDKTKVIMGFLIIILLSLLVLNECSKKTDKGSVIPEIEFTDTNGTYNKIYHDEEIKMLKETNKALYDSIKAYKDEIGYLIQFTAKNKYSTGKVGTGKKDTVNVDATTFEYTNEPNDTMRYNLKINAKEEPNWYSLDITTNNRYTIINKEYDGGMNHTTIEGGEISDVTTFKKKDDTGKKLINRFAIGPSIGVGYDPVNRQFSPIIGVSVTFNLAGN